MDAPTPWTTQEPERSAFALPRGLRGRFAGWIMRTTANQRDLVDLLDVQAGHHVLEVGCGPGALLAQLCRTPADRVCGVDPSPEMLRMSGQQAADDVAAGRAVLREGTAEHTGAPDAAFDRVVSANNVAIWPDLTAGLRELHRATRPGGYVLVAWHGGLRPSPIARRLALSAEQLARVERGLGTLFADVTRHELQALTAFAARR